MKDHELLDAVGGIDEKYVLQAAGEEHAGRGRRIKYAVLAAAIAVIVTAAVILSLSLGTGRPPKGPVVPPDLTESATATQTETEGVVVISDNTDTETEPQTESGSSGDVSMPAPDLWSTIHASSEIVRGTVVGEIGTTQSNPTGDAVNGRGEVIPDGVISFYDLKVEEVFKGDLKVGDTVRIFTAEFITDPDDEVVPYRLRTGQSGIFCINNNIIWTEPSKGTVYRVVHDGWGVFDRVDENGIYHSTVYDLDPADLPSLIAEAR